MNKLKQHLNDSLNELELSPAMEAEILLNTERPARKVRFRSRAVVAALLVVCLLSVTAVAAVVSSGWNWENWDDLTVIPEQPTHSPLDEGPQAYLAEKIAAKERDVAFDTFEDFQKTLGYSLLHADRMQLLADSSTGQLINFYVGGMDSASAQLCATYGGDLYNEIGEEMGVLYLDTILDLDEMPEAVPFRIDPESMSGAIRSQHEIQSLGIVADLVSWPDRHTVYAFFLYDNASYVVYGSAVHPSTGPETAVEGFCSLLELLHE